MAFSDSLYTGAQREQVTTRRERCYFLIIPTLENYTQHSYRPLLQSRS